MERVTISVSDEFAVELALFMATNHYDNRSEAVRDLARRGLRQAHLYNGVAGDAWRRYPTCSTTTHVN